MLKCDISREKFHKFLSLCSLGGELEVREILMNFSKNSIIVSAGCAGNTVGLRGSLEGKFEDFGEIGVDNLPFLRNFFGSQKEETICLKRTENKLISEMKGIKFSGVLRNPKYISNIFPENKYNDFKKLITNQFKIKSEDIKTILTWYKSVKSSDFYFSGKDKLVNIRLDNLGNELSLDIELENKIQSFDTKIPSYFFDVLNFGSQYDLTFSVTNDSPMVYVTLKKDDLEFEYFIAQVVKK